MYKKIEEDEEYKKAWAYGDGIEYAYEKLVKYNETERFPVIKKKIQRNNEELFAIFNELKEQYNNDDYSVDPIVVLNAATELKSRSKNNVRKYLEELRREITNKYKNSLELSKKLQEEVSRLFDDEDKYAISGEDIYRAELKIEVANAAIDVEKVDEDIRKSKFDKIYGDFSQSAFTIAQKDHEVYYQRIIEGFENALGINKKSPNYDKIYSEICKFVQKSKKNIEDEYIYQSLIERFVRDLVEVLIRSPYSSEARLNRFVNEAEVFSGLVMFYNIGDANEGYKKQFLSVAPKNQPLLLALVIHDYIECDESSRNILGHISTINKTLCDNPEVIQLVFSIVKKDPVGGLDAVRKIVMKENYKACKSEEDFLKVLVPSLRNVRKNLADQGVNDKDQSTKKYDFDFTDRKVFEKQYKQFFGDKEVKTYEDVREFFKKDMKILEKFLIHASIPAICIEKPFVAREVQSINKLLERVENTEFDNFIDSNSRLLLQDVMQAYNMAVANLQANKIAVAEVEKILRTLGN